MKREKEMRALLSKNQNRQIDIVDYLVQANGWVHIDELAKTFKCLLALSKLTSPFYGIKSRG